MNIKNITIFFLAFFAGAFCSAEPAATTGVLLFDVMANPISTTELDASEKKHRAALEANSSLNVTNAKIVKVDSTLLDSANAIIVTTPESKKLRFTLQKREKTTTPFFDGFTRKEVTVTSWIAAPNGPAGDYFNAVYLPGGFSAQFSDGGHVYTANSLGTSNRYIILTEKISNATGGDGYMTREQLQKQIEEEKTLRSKNKDAN